MREGSAPNFCPPTEEGITLTFQDEKGDQIDLEFLGLILHEGRRYGFFFPVTEDSPACSSGEIIPLEVTELDEDGQPAAFELVEDQAIAQEVYEDFKQAAKDLYDFEEALRIRERYAFVLTLYFAKAELAAPLGPQNYAKAKLAVRCYVFTEKGTAFEPCPSCFA